MATPAHARYALLAGLLIAPAVACSFLVSTDVYQCSTDGDCAARGPGFANTSCDTNARVCVKGDAAVIEAGGNTDATPDAVATGDGGDDGGPFGCASQSFP